MLMTINDLLCDPSGITAEQKRINDQEWNTPENWKGYIFPSYSSELDSRPFVPARMFRPKFRDDTRWVQVLCTQTVNKAHKRGKIWTTLAWVTVLSIAIIWLVLMADFLWNNY